MYEYRLVIIRAHRNVKIHFVQADSVLSFDVCG